MTRQQSRIRTWRTRSSWRSTVITCLRQRSRTYTRKWIWSGEFSLRTNHQIYSAQTQAFVSSLGEQHSDINRFKLSLRDFLIQLKEFSGDNADLYLEEKETEAQRKAQQERETAMRVPGMLKPSQIEDKDEDI